MNRVPFMITPNESVLVDTIYVEGDGSFYRDKELDLEIIGLPYVPFPVSIQFFYYFHLHILTYNWRAGFYI